MSIRCRHRLIDQDLIHVAYPSTWNGSGDDLLALVERTIEAQRDPLLIELSKSSIDMLRAAVCNKLSNVSQSTRRPAYLFKASRALGAAKINSKTAICEVVQQAMEIVLRCCQIANLGFLNHN